MMQDINSSTPGSKRIWRKGNQRKPAPRLGGPSEHRAPSTGHRAPSTGDRAPSTEHRGLSIGDRAPSTGDRAPGTGEHRAPRPGGWVALHEGLVLRHWAQAPGFPLSHQKGRAKPSFREEVEWSHQQTKTEHNFRSEKRQHRKTEPEADGLAGVLRRRPGSGRALLLFRGDNKRLVFILDF